MKPISYYLTHPSKILNGLLTRLSFLFPGKMYLKMKYRLTMGKKLDLKNPKTFNEKLQCLKLYDRKPEYTIMVDKYAVKKYVADKIGEEYIIPTLGVWDKFEDIDFEKLPNQFVLKCTHDSGGLVICKDKSKLDIAVAKKKIEKCLKTDFYLLGREWPYKNVPRKIISEKYMEDESGKELKDYKWFCFNGEPKYCQVISDRTTNEAIDFFDADWNHQEFTGLALPHKPFNSSPIPIPLQLEKMKMFAKVLSKDISFLRVDFYEINGKLYFGELTFYPASGFGVFTPVEWNEKLGSWIKIVSGKNFRKKLA